jgi:hypothetical protein
MTTGPFAPLDQYQPFVDEFGRVTPEWYSWLSQIANRISGTATFTGGTTVNVLFAATGYPNQPDTDYVIHLENPAGLVLSVTDKNVAGFTISSSTSSSATVRWALARS